MSDNLYKFKCKFRPDDYLDGPVKIYTKEEIEEFVKVNGDVIQARYEKANAMTLEDQVFLDNLKLTQAEEAYSEIMEGTTDTFIREATHE